MERIKDNGYEALDPEAERFIGRAEMMGDQLQNLADYADGLGFPTKVVDLMFQAYNAWSEALSEINRWL